MKIGILVGLGLLLLWTLYSYFASRVEQAAYTVTSVHDGYEIREYSAHIEAQTIVQGSYDESLSAGFRIIAAYIFGANTANQKVAMTAPVVSAAAPEKIAMTAPVQATGLGDEYTISFVMPQTYTLDTLPVPTDTRITLVTIPAHRVAALRFSWYRSPERVAMYQKKLVSLLAQDGMTVTGVPSYAGYNAPGTAPWMIRNEVLVPVL
jgi:SOUL heme-binding protein